MDETPTDRALEELRFLTRDQAPIDLDEADLRRLVKLHRIAGEHADAADCLGELVRRDTRDDQLRLDLGRELLRAGEYMQAVLPLASVSAPRLHGAAWCVMGAAMLAREAAGKDSQDRQPAAADDIARSMVAPAEPSTLIEAFRQAASYDAASVNTWRMYWGAAFGHTGPLPYGRIGILAVPVLAWDDDEWWALTLTELLRHGVGEGFLRGAECAQLSVGSEFPLLLAKGGRLEHWTMSGMSEMVGRIFELKDRGYALRMRDEPVEVEGRDALAIEPAPEGYRLFDLDLPPVESWFDSPSE